MSGDHEWQTISLVRAGALARVSFARPEKKNAMNPRLHEEMLQAVSLLNADDEVRVIVIAGSGGSFCAGADIKEFFSELEHDPARRARVMETARAWMWDAVAQSPKVTLAMIDGVCLGGGMLVAMACDIAVASDRALFGLPEINWGHLPGGAASAKSIEMMGSRRALYYALTGKTFGGREALDFGLVNEVVAHEALPGHVDALAGELAGKSPWALRSIKEIYRAVPGMKLPEVHDYVNAKLDQLRLLDAGGHRSRGMQGFLDKRLRTTEKPGPAEPQ